MRHRRTLGSCLLIAATLACSERAPEPVGAKEGFPPEPTAGEFPGMSYPAHEDGIPRPAHPVWLIGIDGATWKLIRPLVEHGDLPNLAELMRSGAHGTLVSEQPMISPALWATIATGVPRFVHGVTNFVVRRPGTYTTVETGPPDRHSPALWELVGAAGGTSAVISWFGSFPAEPIPGYYLSKRFDPENLEPGQVHPPEFAATLAAEARVTMRRGDVQMIGWTQEMRDALVDDARTLAALRVIRERASPDLVAVYFAGIDIAQHLMWRHMEPSSQAFPEDGQPDRDLAQIIPAYYRYFDHVLGEIRELAPDDATLVIVSDHGGGPLTREEANLLRLPVLLEKLDIQQPVGGEAFAISELYRHDKHIWLNLEGVEPAGVVPPAEAAKRSAALAERLRGLRTGDGRAVFAEVTDHVAREGWTPGDPALSVRFTFAARDAGTIEDRGRTIDMQEVRWRVPNNSGAHRPDGILLLHGPDVSPGALAEPASLYQVAPTVLYLLGLPQDARMLAHAPAGGGVLGAAIDPAMLAEREPRMVAEYPGTDRSGLTRAGEPLDPAHDEAMDKLRGLGYIH